MDTEVRGREERAVFDTVEEAIEEIRQGRMVLVADDESRENEGDLIVAAVHATAGNVNFMARYARGLICAPVSGEIARRLQLAPLTAHNTDKKSTAFLVTVDARDGTTTGISAAERALTARLLADPDARPEDFLRPGHLFPLEARESGVLVRAGHTEATVDLVRLAGLPAAGLCCEVMKDDGTMARLPDLIEFAKRHGLKFIAVKDLIAWRCARERLIEKQVEVSLPTEFGLFRVHAYRSRLQDDDAHTHVALVKGDVSDRDSVLVRVHSECFTGDIFGSLRCDCGPQLHAALAMIEREGAGVLLYMRQEGRAFAERFNAALDAVMNRMLERTRSRRLIVPLSGGLDSRLLVAWLVNHADAVGGRVRTFTYGVPGAREVEVSREVARAAGLEWTAVDYERRPLLEAWHAPATGDFLRACYALSALPHVQDWYALMRLRQRGWLTEGDVVLPGHTIVGNMHDEDRLIGGGRVDQVEVARAIVAHHADLQGRAERAWQDPWTAPPLRRALGLAGFDGGELSVRSAVEGYNFRERQTKYINNSVRAYEFFGLDWDLPMLDAEMWHAWARGSARLTVDRSYYRWLVDRQWQRAVGGTAGMASAYYQVTPVPARARSRIKGVLRRTGTLAGAERIFSAWSSLHSSMGFDALITDTPRPRAALELLAGRKTLGFWTTAFLADTWSRGARLFSGLDVRRP